MKIPNKKELQQIPIDYLSDIDFQNSMEIYKKYSAKLYSFLVKDSTLQSNNSLYFRKNLLTRL